MPVYEVNIAVPGREVQTVTIQDERELERLSLALADDGYIAAEEVRIVWTGVEYEGRKGEYSALEQVGRIAVLANNVLFVRQLEVSVED